MLQARFVAIYIFLGLWLCASLIGAAAFYNTKNVQHKAARIESRLAQIEARLGTKDQIAAAEDQIAASAYAQGWTILSQKVLSVKKVAGGDVSVHIKVKTRQLGTTILEVIEHEGTWQPVAIRQVG